MFSSLWTTYLRTHEYMYSVSVVGAPTCSVWCVCKVWLCRGTGTCNTYYCLYSMAFHGPHVHGFFHYMCICMYTYMYMYMYMMKRLRNIFREL